jgi:LysM repeat protein
MLRLVISVIFILQGICGFSGESHTKGFWHRVVWGETLSSIAARYGLSTDFLADINSICNKNKIISGSRIWIPGFKLVKAHAYTVKKGDYLIGIASRYGVDPWDIASLNGIFDLNLVFPGEKIYIPVKKEN